MAKLSYFRQFPWKLLALAHHDHGMAVRTAQECIKLYELDVPEPGLSHRQTRRFMDRNFIGVDSSDISLWPFVEMLAAGRSLDEPEMAPLCKWLARLAATRVSERSVEGIHSLVTKDFRRSPAASMAFVSVELRLPDIVRTLTTSRNASWFVCSLQCSLWCAVCSIHPSITYHCPLSIVPSGPVLSCHSAH